MLHGHARSLPQVMLQEHARSQHCLPTMNQLSPVRNPPVSAGHPKGHSQSLLQDLSVVFPAQQVPGGSVWFPHAVCVSWGISLCWQPPFFQHCSQRLLGILAFALAAAVCSSCLWLVPHCRTNSIPIESTIWLQARPANCC